MLPARPSLLLRLRPNNLPEAWDAFVASEFTVAPRFTYNFPEEYVTKQFEENSEVCFELLPDAERILEKVKVDFGGPEAFMEKLYGEEKVPAEELRDAIEAYVKEHGVEDKVDIKIVDSVLSAANVVSHGDRYIINVASGLVHKTQVQGICDHEVGTHLLRMMNDEHQVWHNRRERFKLLNPWTTEEGFATLNTFISMPVKLLYPQALRYYAVCRGARVGFVELFQELRALVGDPGRCWQMCCRIKRGMMDTSQPGAFYMDQAYFKGAVEILRHLDEVDFGRLYGGQIALQDLNKVHFLLRKECVRLPRFLNTAEKLAKYMTHCRRLIKENLIETAAERVCRPVFVRTAREFFKKSRAELRAASATLSLGGSAANREGNSSVPPRLVDAQRLEDLARPRQPVAPEEGSEQAAQRQRRLDLNRITELAMPRARTVDPEDHGGSCDCEWPARPVDLSRLAELAKPRALVIEAVPAPVAEAPPREPNRARLIELALPRLPVRLEAEAGGAEAASASRPAGRARRSGSDPLVKTGAARRKRRSGRKNTGGDEQQADNGSAGGSGDEGGGGEEGGEERVSRRRERSRARALAEAPPPPPPPPVPDPPTVARPIDLARLNELALPRKVCQEERERGQPCACAPKARRKRRSKLRLLALVREKEGEEEEALGEQEEEGGQEEDGGGGGAGEGPESPLSASTALPGSDESSAGGLSSASTSSSASSVASAASTSSAGLRAATPPPTLPSLCSLPSLQARALPEISPAEQRRAESSGPSARGPEARAARGGAFARARSMGDGLGALSAGPAAAAGVALDPEPAGAARATTPGAPAPLVPPALRSGARSHSRPPRAPTAGQGLRGLAAAAPGAEQPMWKAVPIKMMQLELAF